MNALYLDPGFARERNEQMRREVSRYRMADRLRAARRNAVTRPFAGERTPAVAGRTAPAG